MRPASEVSCQAQPFLVARPTRRRFIARAVVVVWALAVFACVPGCGLNALADLESAQARSRVLAEQNRAQLSEIENLRHHGRQTENDLRSAEQRLVSSEEQLALVRRQLANYQGERSRMHEQMQGILRDRGPLAPEEVRRLEVLAQHCPSLQFDSVSGVGKLDSEILFDSGKAELKPGANQVLDDLAQLLKMPEASDLRVLVVGHTDGQGLKRAARDQFSDNFDLSSSRAHAVTAYLQRQGLPEKRLGMAGFGSQQPVAGNESYSDRQKNRRVEVFVLAPDAPVVGWTDSVPGLYRR